MDQPTDNLRVVREVIAAFDALGIAYALGGSLASSIHGITRYTADADLAVEPFPGLEDRLAASFGPDYYASLDGDPPGRPRPVRRSTSSTRRSVSRSTSSSARNGRSSGR